MAKVIANVEIKSSGIFIRFLDGSCRTIGVGQNGSLIHYTNEGITFKTSSGSTCYYDLQHDSVRTIH